MTAYRLDYHGGTRGFYENEPKREFQVEKNGQELLERSIL